MQKMIPITEAKAKLTELVREAEDSDVVLLRHGRPAAILVAPDRLEALISRLEDAEDKLSVYESGDGGSSMSFEKLKAELALDD